MRIKAGKKLMLAISFVLAASGAQAGVLGAAGAPYASLGTVSSASDFLMQGAGSYLDSASIMNAYYNVAGGMRAVAGANPWDSARSWLDNFSNLGPIHIQLPPVAVNLAGPDMPDVLLPDDTGAQAAALPEPASFAVFGLGLAGLRAARRRAS